MSFVDAVIRLICGVMALLTWIIAFLNWADIFHPADYSVATIAYTGMSFIWWAMATRKES